MSLGCMKTHAKPPGVVQKGGMELTPNTIHVQHASFFHYLRLSG